MAGRLDVAGRTELDVIIDYGWHSTDLPSMGFEPAGTPVIPEDEPVEYAEELAWLDAHGEELARYAGEWVALAQGRIVAHDPSVGVVMAAAREQGIERPFLIPVPPEGALAV
ncbi:MAG: DUF5678 domain-containing protein [Chloroflexota bacterium]|nr:DUF5678 domain-containing protein [Chloroflexota bacterium]